MKKVLGSVAITVITMLFVGCASKDASTNGFAKNQLEEMKKPSKHRLSK
ncbi:MAG: hypothetical protein J7J31_10140 [Helicobacteraceae bacterium]|nr:hypothetical protein [Helicobacteraceae bacterium]